MTFKVSNLTNGIVEFDGIFWQPAQTRELKTVTEEMLEAAASNVLLIVEVTQDSGIPKGFLGIKPVTSPHLLSDEDAGYVLVFNEDTSAVINVPDGIEPGVEAGYRNKNVAQITVQALEGSSMQILGAGTITNDSSKVNSLYVEDATTVITAGDLS